MFTRASTQTRSTLRLLLGLAVALSLSCSSDSNPLFPSFPSSLATAPQRDGDGFLTIQTGKTQYTRGEISLMSGGGSIHATVVNHSDQLFHAILGDGFNGAPEQQYLFVAEASDGFLDQWIPTSGWKSLARGTLIEGVRSIELRPHSTYVLIAHAMGDETPGQFQLKVRYADEALAVHQDYSNVFVVR